MYPLQRLYPATDMTINLFNFYNELRNDSLSFIYNGEVSDDVTEGIIKLTDHNVSNIEGLAKIRKRVSFIMVECFQNLVRHGNSEEQGSLFSTRLIDESNYVSSINRIPINDIEVLREKLELINHLEKDKLKALYLEVLKGEGLSEKGGAGIGLIQIARKTGRPVDFDFENVDESLSNFYMSLKLTGSNEDREADHGKAMRFTQSFDKKVKDSKILMIYKGDFGRDSIMPIISILEERMQRLTDDSKSKAFFLILVELLQNVSRHAMNEVDRSGIFMITEEDNKIGIYVGNIVDEEAKTGLEKKLKALNELDAAGLKSAYKKTLRDGTFSEKGGAGLGLIEIARKSNGPMESSFDKVNDHHYFFTFSVNF